MALPVAVRHGPFDLDVAYQPGFGDALLPTLAFVDLHPGGAGFASAITAEVVGRLSRLALEVLGRCPAGCVREDGCPACLQTWHCHEADSALSRSGARAALTALLGTAS
jgi:DEAD/DEAH box helicase domain-containing protein